MPELPEVETTRRGIAPWLRQVMTTIATSSDGSQYGRPIVWRQPEPRAIAAEASATAAVSVRSTV